MDLCKCGLAGMDLDDADALENYAIEHRIRGIRAWTSTEPWTYHGKQPDDEDAALAPIDEDATRIDRLRRGLVEWVATLSNVLKGDPRPAREHLLALWACMDGFKVRQIDKICKD